MKCADLEQAKIELEAKMSAYPEIDYDDEELAARQLLSMSEEQFGNYVDDGEHSDWEVFALWKHAKKLDGFAELIEKKDIDQEVYCTLRGMLSVLCDAMKLWGNEEDGIPDMFFGKINPYGAWTVAHKILDPNWVESKNG